MVKKRFIPNILVALVLMLTAVVITAGCGIRHHHHDDYNPYDQQSSSGDESNDNGGNSDNGSNDNGDNGGTDYSSVERVPDYKNTNPYKVVVTKVNTSPSSMTMDYTLNGQTGTVNGEVDGENVVFKVADPAASAQSEQDKTSNVNPKAGDESSQESGFVVKKIDIDEYTLSTNVEVDSDVKCFEFQFAELNNDNEDLEGDYLVVLSKVEQKPISAELKYSPGSILGPGKICNKWVYNTKAKTVKFLIEDEEVDSHRMATINSISLSGCITNTTTNYHGYSMQVQGGQPCELIAFYDEATQYELEVTDTTSSLPEFLNFSNMEKEIAFTTNLGKYVRYSANMTSSSADKLKFSADEISAETRVIQINKIRVGNRLYKCGFNLYPTQGKALELDLSSGFEKVAIPYNAVVVDCSSDEDGILIFKADDKEYLVNGTYSSNDQRMVYDFKSPADKLDITLIQIGARKSTAELDRFRKNNLSPAATHLYPFLKRPNTEKESALSLTMMGTNGNVWTNQGCPSCKKPGSGTEYTGDLDPGDGKCPYGSCTACGHTGNCPDCSGSGVQEILWPLN